MKRSEASGPDMMKLYNAHDLPIGATSRGLVRERNKTGAWRFFKPVFRELLSPCESSCPAGTPIRNFIKHMRDNAWEEAYRVLLEENPFPSVCGRVCFHYCEQGCLRGTIDETIAIRDLERVVGDYGLSLKIKINNSRAELRSEKIVVIGSGPAGMTCAYFLSKMGYNPSVFEAMPKPGGVLRYGIPDYRLPDRILDREIARIKAMGVTIKTSTMMGRDIKWEELESNDAVFLAAGAFEDKALSLQDSDLKGVWGGLSFLKGVKQAHNIELGRRVLVIGGGNTAMDCARTALRLGVETTVLYRRSEEEMPAFEEEIKEAREEGVIFHFLTSPVRLLNKDDRFSGLECRRNTLVDPRGRNSRPRPVAVEDSLFCIESDSIIFAVGESSELSPYPENIIGENGKIVVDDWGTTKHPGVFAGGDVIDQPHSVSHAICSGKKAAIAIDFYLKNKRQKQPGRHMPLLPTGSLSMREYIKDGFNSPSKKVVSPDDINKGYTVHMQKPSPKQTSVHRRTKGFVQIYSTLSASQARLEADRCLVCGSCSGCMNCFYFCPDSSIILGTQIEIDYDYCKGCGICQTECPTGYISMETEETE